MVLNSTFVLKKEIVSNYSNFGAALVAVMSVIAVLMIFFALKTDCKEVKKSNQNAVDLLLVNACAIFIAAATIIAFNNLKSDREDYNPTSLIEIKDAITIENDKVSIAPLTQFNSEYRYAGIRNSNQKQIFKLEEDNFFEKYQLVDQLGNKLLIDSEEYKMLNDKRK